MALANKIAAASKNIGGTLKKDKANAEQGYRYVSADAILDAGGQALAEQGVTVYPGIVGYAVDPVMYKEGKLRYDARVDFLMRLADDTELMELPWVGMGSDYTVPDKALYKAITSGHRYFIGKLLNIGANNEDGEHEAGDMPETHQDKSTPAPTCPKCGGAMWDNREKVAAGAKGPEWSCKKAGKWNPETKQRDGCQGVYWAGEWPPAESPKPVAEPPAHVAQPEPPKVQAPANGNGDKPRLAVIRTPEFVKHAQAFADKYPRYASKNGGADGPHILAAAAKCGYSEITGDNIGAVFAALKAHAEEQMALPA